MVKLPSLGRSLPFIEPSRMRQRLNVWSAVRSPAVSALRHRSDLFSACSFPGALLHESARQLHLRRLSIVCWDVNLGNAIPVSFFCILMTMRVMQRRFGTYFALGADFCATCSEADAWNSPGYGQANFSIASKHFMLNRLFLPD